MNTIIVCTVLIVTRSSESNGANYSTLILQIRVFFTIPTIYQIEIKRAKPLKFYDFELWKNVVLNLCLFYTSQFTEYKKKYQSENINISININKWISIVHWHFIDSVTYRYWTRKNLFHWPVWRPILHFWNWSKKMHKKLNEI